MLNDEVPWFSLWASCAAKSLTPDRVRIKLLSIATFRGNGDVMELIDRDLKCLFCKAACLLVKDHEYLREIGFTHDPENCRDCGSLPEHAKLTIEKGASE
jgi:hypothetical protein